MRNMPRWQRKLRNFVRTCKCDQISKCRNFQYCKFHTAQIVICDHCALMNVYVCVIYRTRNVLEIEFYPSWNILEYTGISFLYCCTNPDLEAYSKGKYYLADGRLLLLNIIEYKYKLSGWTTQVDDSFASKSRLFYHSIRWLSRELCK